MQHWDGHGLAFESGCHPIFYYPPVMLALLQVPSLESTKWENYVHAVMWRVGRHFGFQAFNPNPKTADLVGNGYAGQTAPCCCLVVHS